MGNVRREWDGFYCLHSTRSDRDPRRGCRSRNRTGPSSSAVRPPGILLTKQCSTYKASWQPLYFLRLLFSALKICFSSSSLNESNFQEPLSSCLLAEESRKFTLSVSHVWSLNDSCNSPAQAGSQPSHVPGTRGGFGNTACSPHPQRS